MSELTIQLKSSRQFALLLCCAHFVTACILWKLDGSIFVNTIGLVLLFISLYFYLWQHALLLAPQSLVLIRLLEDGLTCIAQTRANKTTTFTIKYDTFVAPYLTVLSLKSPNSFFSRCVVIFPDGIDNDKFRELRIWLRWKGRK